MIEYLNKAIGPLVLKMPKILKVKDGDKDKNNKFMPFHIDDAKLLEKYKAIWTKIENLKNIKLSAFPVYDD